MLNAINKRLYILQRTQHLQLSSGQVLLHSAENERYTPFQWTQALAVLIEPFYVKDNRSASK
jgi:hypothetical protein